MSDEVEYIELRRRSPDEAIVHASMKIAQLQQESREVRALLGLMDGATHDDLLRHLHRLRIDAAEAQRVAQRVVALTGQVAVGCAAVR